MKASGRGVAGLLGAVLFGGCNGVDGRSGLDEPIVVHNAQFFAGELPGQPPVAPGSDVPRVPPSTSSGTPSRAEVRQGLAGVSFTGQASDDAFAVAVRFDDVGSGYWLLPTLYEDAQTQKTLVWTFVADFQHSLEAVVNRMISLVIDTVGS